MKISGPGLAIALALAACGGGGGGGDDDGDDVAAPDGGVERGDPGDVDPSFGEGGAMLATYAIGALAPAGDGSALALEGTGLLHVEAGGAIDPAIDPATFVGAWERMVATGDGRFLAVHDDYWDDSYNHVARIGADLALDPGFSTADRLTDFGPSDVAAGADGTVYVVGTRQAGGSQVVVKALDPTGATVLFEAVTDPALDLRGSGIAVLPDGSLMVRGEDGFTPCLIHLTAAGELDAGFGTGGVLPVPELGPRYSRALAVDAGGGVLLLGMTNETIQLARVLPGGTLDTAFGVAGVAEVDITRPLSSEYDEFVEARGLLVGSDGRLVITASYQFDQGEDDVFEEQSILLVRLTADGALDPSFGDGGTTRVHLAPGAAPSRIYEPVVSELGDDRLLIGGEALDANTWRGGLTAVWR